MKKQNIIPILIPNKKYPYNCTWNQNEGKNVTKEELKKVVESQIKKETEAEEVEVAFLGKCFSEIKEEKQNDLLKIVNEFIENGQVNSIRIAVNPNQVTKEMLKMYKKYNVKTIELETVSCNDYILKCTKMQYNYKEIKKAARMIRWRGFTLGCQMMVGLPDSTRIDEINTAKRIAKLKPKVIRISPLYVMEGTKLEKEYKKEKYAPLTVMQGVEICKDLVRYFADKDIETIRIGYQDADIKEGKGIIEGPYHPGFRELVEIAMWYDAIVGKIKQLNAKVKEVEVTVNPSDVENVIGIKNENILKLKETYNVDLIVKADEEIKQGKSKIEIVQTYNN